MDFCTQKVQKVLAKTGQREGDSGEWWRHKERQIYCSVSDDSFCDDATPHNVPSESVRRVYV